MQHFWGQRTTFAWQRTTNPNNRVLTFTSTATVTCLYEAARSRVAHLPNDIRNTAKVQKGLLLTANRLGFTRDIHQMHSWKKPISIPEDYQFYVGAVEIVIYVINFGSNNAINKTGAV